MKKGARRRPSSLSTLSTPDERGAHDAIVRRARDLADLVRHIHPNDIHRASDEVRAAWDEMLRLAKDWDGVRVRARFVGRYLGNVEQDTDERFLIWRSGFNFVMAGHGRRVTNPLPAEPVAKMVALADGDPWLPTPEERDAKVQEGAAALQRAQSAAVS